MGELSIKIKIGEREYPMRVSASEEERLRLAGRMINEKMKNFRDSFGIDDRQDLLAMVAFDCMVDKIKSEDNQKAFSNEMAQKIANLDQIIDSSFSG
jgi:cell division protein ZapA